MIECSWRKSILFSIFCFFVATPALALTMQEYAAKCDQAIGATVPQFSCRDGAEIPLINNINGTCDNPAFLSQGGTGCEPGGFLGKIFTNNPDVEIRFLCRHYKAPNLGRERSDFNDIAVIQTNTKNGATCFYQSNTGASLTLRGDNVPAPSSGDLNILSSPGPVSCVSCHNARPFIETPHLKHVPVPHKIPPPQPMDRYWFPGDSSVVVYKVTAENDRSCSLCHNIATTNQGIPGGSSGEIGEYALGKISNPNTRMRLDKYKFMGTGTSFGTHSSFDAHVACITNRGGPGCSIVDITTPFRRDSISTPDPTGPGGCLGDQWYSSDLNRCFPKNGQCSQYDWTNDNTCNSSHDNFSCDWNGQRCTPASDSGSQCRGDEWFSGELNRCFAKNGQCSQYNWTNDNTCNSSHDNFSCDWNGQLCTPASDSGSNCGADQWFSSEWNRCFPKNGQCNQYNWTNDNTCNSSNDNFSCNWDGQTNQCTPENNTAPRCNSNQWYSSSYGRCFEKHGECGQYNWTDESTCNAQEDSLFCDWDNNQKNCVKE